MFHRVLKTSLNEVTGNHTTVSVFKALSVWLTRSVCIFSWLEAPLSK